MLKELETTVGENKLDPRYKELALRYFPHLVWIDHGYSPDRAGYTASGFVTASGHVYTAAHNLLDGRARVIHPFLQERATLEFREIYPDTAISVKPCVEWQSDICVGDAREGDMYVAFWLRHMGGGSRKLCFMWGENIGLVMQSGKQCWGFVRHGDYPQEGDSGAMIMRPSSYGQTVEPVAVGLFRGTILEEEICVFSPV